jgi:hypothetical protein
MSTTDNSGQEPEQQTQPVAEAGCEGKVSRSVPGTDLRSGFAELRAWAKESMEEAREWGGPAKGNGEYARGWWSGHFDAFQMLDRRLNANEADAKDASTGS